VTDGLGPQAGCSILQPIWRLYEERLEPAIFVFAASAYTWCRSCSLPGGDVQGQDKDCRMAGGLDSLNQKQLNEA
jgi:hypothetical protein